MKKNTFKNLIGLFFISLALYSCSTDTDEKVLNALEQELALENTGILKVASTTYIFKNSGETVKFIDTNREFDFIFLDEIKFNTVEDSKHAVEGLKVTNPATSEFIIFRSFEELKDGRIQFDVELSTGQKVFGVTYSSKEAFNSGESKWHEDPPRAITSPVVGAVIEMSQDEVNGHCKAAVDVCAKSGGKATVGMRKGNRWFSAPAECTVGCN